MSFHPASILFKYLQITQFNIHNALIKNKLKNNSQLFQGIWIDIGAGNQPYKEYFGKAQKYLTTNTRRHYNENQLAYLDKLTDYWIEDGTNLPLENESVNGVACLQVLSVISNPEMFFKEVNRVIKPGGCFLLTTDFLYPVWSNEDVMRHTTNHIKQLALKNGFQIEKTESFGGFLSTLYALVTRFTLSFPSIWKTKSLVGKTVTGLIYGILLPLIPVVSLCGLIIFLLENNVTSRNDFTFNHWVVARKI